MVTHRFNITLDETTALWLQKHGDRKSSVVNGLIRKEIDSKMTVEAVEKRLKEIEAEWEIMKQLRIYLAENPDTPDDNDYEEGEVVYSAVA